MVFIMIYIWMEKIAMLQKDIFINETISIKDAYKKLDKTTKNGKRQK